MLFATIGQARVFLWMLAAGALTGAWYAVLCALRRLLAAGALLSLAADVAFGLGAAVIFCLALFSANYGALRLYAVLAALLGFALFMLGAFPAGRRLFLTFYKIICHILSTIAQFRWIKVIFK